MVAQGRHKTCPYEDEKRGIFSGERIINIIELESVILMHDMPEKGLQAGDIGTVVQVYFGDEVEVEFVRATGETQALLTLTVGDVRKIGVRDMLAARQLVERKKMH